MNCSLFFSGAHLKGVNNAVTESAFDEFVCCLCDPTPFQVLAAFVAEDRQVRKTLLTKASGSR